MKDDEKKNDLLKNRRPKTKEVYVIRKIILCGKFQPCI